ncbi:MAG: hypothetical protein SFY81_12120 [Verrucomicrobiota bacterium]|nr:hypothetical protein [Verrucomicrobiota bacterium]
MNPEKFKFRHDQDNQAQANSSSQALQQQFATPEEALQFDARQTTVPREVAERLNESISQEPKQPDTWWKRLFGKE